MLNQEQLEEARAAIIAHVKAHGPDDLLSPRARREQEAVRRRLQEIADAACAICEARNASSAGKKRATPSR